MPGKIKVKILAGRNLPVMDRSGDTTDAYVEIKFGNTTYKTDVCRKSLNPQWNSEWYKFEVEDAELQDEPLQIRLMDHDTYSANDAIGKVYVNLNPLLLPGVPPPVKNIWTLEASINSGTGSQGGSVMTGWIPVYDTMHGIRGEVNIIVKVELFLDFNKFRQSSCGVTFFYSSIIPHGYHAQVIHGFVEELVISDDPEYKWIDKIRTPRASNEARQTLFLKLSNEVQRKIGLKALDLGGNAVIGYLQNFDLEGESGIVARGIGTVVTLVKLLDFPNFLPEAPSTDDLQSQALAISRATKPSQSPDCSESESSPRLPPRHHHHQHHHHHHHHQQFQHQSSLHQHHRTTSHSNIASISTSPACSPTILGSKFPLYGENLPLQQITPLKPMVECKPPPPQPPLSRHASIQSWKSITSSKPNVMGSNLSLADDSIDEAASFRAMLALEDMRGEPQGNRFSRGLKNLRYNVLAKRGRVRPPIDSLDDESSDFDSSHSSSWSICGSDSAANSRPQSNSVVDLRQNIRKKKLRHRKNSGENIAAMLIRSVHVGGLPLDIVKVETPKVQPKCGFLLYEKASLRELEDRETPTPSPVNFADDPVHAREVVPVAELEKISENESLSDKIEDQKEDNGNVLAVVNSKLSVTPENNAIPMISSSESDTSSSEGDREDDPSESSTNYNILDDTLSLLEPSSPEIENYPMLGDSPFKLHSSTLASFAPQLPSEEKKEENQTILLDIENASPPPVPTGTQSMSIDEMLSSEFSSDVDSDLPVSAIPDDYRIKRTKKLPSPSRTSKSMERERPKRLPEPLHLSIPPPSSHIEESFKVPSTTSETASTDDPSSSDKLPKSSSKSRHRLLKQLSIVQKTESENSESSEEEYYPKKQLRAAAITKIQDSKPLIDLDDDEHLNDHRRDKSPRRVERTATVIYKGPKDKNLIDQTVEESPSSPPLSPVILNPPLVPKSPTIDANHLQIPAVNLKDIVPKSPFPPGEPTFNFSDDLRVASMLMKKYRRNCMLDLIKLIDSRMISHHHSHSDSTRRRKHQVTPQVKRNQTPSPTTYHRRSRSKSPEANNHHHSRHHQESRLTRQTSNKHHESNESLFGSKLTLTPNFEAKVGSTGKTLARIDSENLEMVEMPVDRSVTMEIVEAIVVVSRDRVTIDSKSNINGSSENKSSSGGNGTDDLGVSQLPSRQQEKERQEKQLEQSQQATSPVHNNHKVVAQSPMTKNSGVLLHRRSSDSDLSITPKGNSLTGSDRSMGGYLKPSTAIIRNMNQEALEMLEYPFITMQQYPPGFVLHIGGLVSARSVKLLERVNNLEEPEGRDSWWTEIRMEVRSHARALACNVVIGYREETSICDDVCVLSVSGTAAVISLHSTGQDQDNVLITHVQGPMTASTESDKVPSVAAAAPTATTTTTVVSDRGSKISSELSISQNPSTPQSMPPAANSTPVVTSGTGATSSGSGGAVGNSSAGASGGTGAARPFGRRNASESNDHEPAYALAASACSPCHLPYNKASINFQVNVSKCAVCRRAAVPDVMFSTVELPEGVPMTGRGCLIQATVCKAKKDLRGELHAKDVSDCLPFLEYELHSLLLNKLRVRGMNAVFGIRSQLSIGERFIVGAIVGTAVYLTALPPPSPPQIARGNSWHDEEQIAEMQKCLLDTVRKNVEFYQLKPLPELENGRSTSDTDESEDELPELDLGIGMKDVCVLEVDDVEDLDRINLLLDDRPPSDFHVVNTETIPGLEDLEIVRNLQMFTQVSRAKIPSGQSASMPSKYFARLLQTVFFKLRRMVPCALCDLQFKLSMPEQDEIQLSVVGMAVGLGEPTKCSKYRRKLIPRSISRDQVKKAEDNDMIFCLDEDHGESALGEISPNAAIAHNITNPTNNQTLAANLSQRSRPRSPLRVRHTSHRHKHVPLKERYGVDITPLSYLPGGRIDRYLGNLNFFFIRESNSIRENGGLSGFIHSFVTEVLAILRAHVRALGGNAMVAFFMTQCVLLHSPHKNQGQCLINVGGDVVNVSYFGNDSRQQQSINANGGNC